MADINSKDVLGDYEEKPDIWASAVRRLLIVYLWIMIHVSTWSVYVYTTTVYGMSSPPSFSTTTQQ
jgi:hypothetical protein